MYAKVLKKLTKYLYYDKITLGDKMKDCIFCKIGNNETESYKLYENDKVIVFMDINPNSNGHMLVVPKKHITDFTEMDNETLASINEVTKKMAKLIEEKLKPDGIQLIVNYGFLQIVKHYHLHIVPIYKEKQKINDIRETYEKLMSD